MVNILIVDDEEPIRRLLQRILEKNEGYCCTQAANAAEARARLQDEQFELVLTDVNMPGETGLDLTRYIQANHPDTAVIIVSVMDERTFTEEALELGIYGYIVKPFDPRSVAINVANAMRRRKLEIENRAHRQRLEQLIQERTKLLKSTQHTLEKTEVDLREKEKEYALLLKALPGFVYKGYPDWSVHFIDDRVEGLTGYSRGEFNSNRLKWSDIILEKDLPAARDCLVRAMKNSKSFVREYRIKTKTGRIVWIEDRGQILCDNTGRIEHISGVFFDITDHKIAENAVALAKEEWERTFDAVPDLIMIVDKEFRIKRVNKAMADVLQIKPEEAVDLLCYKAVHQTDEPIPGCPHHRTLMDGKDHVREVVGERCGRNFLVSTSPLHDPGGKLIGSVHVARDITAVKRAERELRAAHAEMEQLIASISSILISIDRENRISRWNKAAEEVFGSEAQEVLGRRLDQCTIQWQWQKVGDNLLRCRNEKTAIQLNDIEFTRKDGRVGFLRMSLNPITGANNRHEGILILARDITDRRQLESQLAQAQKLESIGQLAAGIAHEINTPTQYVGDNIRFLEEAFDDLGMLLAKHHELIEQINKGEPVDKTVQDIKAAAVEIDVDYLLEEVPKAIAQSLEGVERVAKIVQAMKEFSHPGSTEKTYIDVNKAIESTITIARNEWKYVAEVTTEFDPTLPPVPCLPNEFNQVILNIIINAAHAIADSVGKDTGKKGCITFTTRRKGPWCEVAIKDTGTGIPEEIKSKIFDPFFTTKEVGKGTGQGLAIAHSVIVDKHGGTISCESRVGKGTTFTIRLPLEK
ncbi:MAG: PAS domain S-box protein [Deltaproteobacteria bacterium]|nr:PAS domain S-box protein [Deltaproteobacteria bacterium]